MSSCRRRRERTGPVRDTFPRGGYPPLSELRVISREIAVAVGLTACEEGLAEPIDEETLRRRIAEFVWEPDYPRIKS